MTRHAGWLLGTALGLGIGVLLPIGPRLAPASADQTPPPAAAGVLYAMAGPTVPESTDDTAATTVRPDAAPARRDLEAPLDLQETQPTQSELAAFVDETRGRIQHLRRLRAEAIVASLVGPLGLDDYQAESLRRLAVQMAAQERQLPSDDNQVLQAYADECLLDGAGSFAARDAAFARSLLQARGLDAPAVERALADMALTGQRLWASDLLHRVEATVPLSAAQRATAAQALQVLADELARQFGPDWLATAPQPARGEAVRRIAPLLTAAQAQLLEQLWTANGLLGS